MKKRDNIYALVWLCFCLAIVMAFTAHRWGPIVDTWPGDPIIATADMHLKVLQQARCK